MTKEKKQAAEHAHQMLSKYLTEGSQLYHFCVGHVISRDAATKFRRVFAVIYDGRIVNVNLYIANLCGYRKDDSFNLITRETPQEIAADIGLKIGRTVKVTSP